MVAFAVLAGPFFYLVAFILLVLVSVSPPTWESVYFLNAGTGASRIRFGAFGYTGFGTTIGYGSPPAYSGYNNPSYGGNPSNVVLEIVIHNLTPALVLYPIAAAYSGLAVLFGLYRALNHRWGTFFMYLFSIGAFFITLGAWVTSMTLWGITRNVLRDNGVSAQYGNANWLAIGVIITLFIGIFSFIYAPVWEPEEEFIAYIG